MNVTAFDIAQRFVGIGEIGGSLDNPQILAMLRLDADWPEHDEVPWCSAFVNYVCWLLRLPRSRDLRARSWLSIGQLVRPPMLPSPGFDVVVLQRGLGTQPGPEVVDAPGHVGFFAGMTDTHVELLGGNQGDSVSIARFPVDRILATRRLM